MAVITISRQFGAGGKTLGKLVAEELGYTFAGDDVIQMIAKEANVSAEWVNSFEKEAGSTMSRMVEKMVSRGLVEKVLKDERGYLDESIYLDYLVLIVAKMADEGNVVILGRGSQYILRDHPDAFHFLLIDEFDHRVNFMMDHYGMSANKAIRTVNSEDRRRDTLYRRLGKKDYDNPSLYDMVINMNRVKLEKAKNLIINLATS